MLTITERLEYFDCKNFASHVREFGRGWYEKQFPLTPGNLRPFSPLEQLMMYKAVESMPNAETDYSHFNVGACMLVYDGQLFMGQNKETAAYHGLHAEEVAWAKLPKGESGLILAVAIAMRCDDKKAPPMPRGECRQKIFEHAAGNIPIVGIKVNQDNKIWEIDLTNIDHLLPYAFGRNNLIIAPHCPIKEKGSE